MILCIKKIYLRYFLIFSVKNGMLSNAHHSINFLESIDFNDICIFKNTSRVVTILQENR